jgi:ankyrin repeat protein
MTRRRSRYTTAAARAVDVLGRTALHLAAMAGHTEVLRSVERLATADSRAA